MGILDCYNLSTCEEIYRKRISHQGGGFSASPVAADGKLYLSGEDGDVFVVKAGPEYQLLATNEMGELWCRIPGPQQARLTTWLRGSAGPTYAPRTGPGAGEHPRRDVR